jgi:hypothetical protein
MYSPAKSKDTGRLTETTVGVSLGTSLTNIVYGLAFPLVVTAILVVIFIRTDSLGKALEIISPPKTSTEEIAVLCERV